MNKVLMALFVSFIVFALWPGRVAGASGLVSCLSVLGGDGDCLQSEPSMLQIAEAPRLICKGKATRAQQWASRLRY